MIGQSGRRLVDLRFIGGRAPRPGERELCELLVPATGPLQPALALLMTTARAANWRALRKRLCALIVLQKRSLSGT